MLLHVCPLHLFLALPSQIHRFKQAARHGAGAGQGGAQSQYQSQVGRQLVVMWPPSFDTDMFLVYH
jgi:hypothetical protein